MTCIGLPPLVYWNLRLDQRTATVLLLMESFGGSGFSAGGCIVRKKRSVVSHKPRLDPLTFSERSSILLRIVHPFGKESLDKNHDSKEKGVHSDGLRSEKRPKKLKLKLRGVTHTIQTKCTVDSSLGGGSSIPKSSCPSDDFIPQPKPLLQVPTVMELLNRSYFVPPLQIKFILSTCLI